MLDLHVGHLDTPGRSLLVQNGLDVRIQALPLRQHIVQFMLSQHRPQGGLGQLAGRFQEVLDLDDGALGIHHPEINHRVHLHRYVVPGDDILGGHVHHHGAQVHPHHLLQYRYDYDQAGALDLVEAAQHENYPALILPQDPEHRQCQGDRQEQDDHAEILWIEHYACTPLSLLTRRVKPSIACTTTRSRGSRGSSQAASHNSPSRRAQAVPLLTDSMVATAPSK